MTVARIAGVLLQSEAESDGDFVAKLREQSRAGLQTIAFTFAGVAAFMGFTNGLLLANSIPPGSAFPATMMVAALLFCLVASRARFAFPRLIGCVCLTLAGAGLMWISLLRTDIDPAADRYIAGQMALTLMIAVVSMPVIPVQLLSLGSALTLLYLLAVTVGPWAVNATMIAILVMLTLLATALAAIVYSRTWESYKVYAAQIDASRERSRAEIRRFVAQSAATTSRMAAALSHELNTPVGALKSSIDTLSALASRREGASEAQLHRIASLEQQVRQSAKDAATRLQQVVQALQRVTNLDRAEVQEIDLNSLLKDVVYLLESEMRLRQREVELSLGNLPPVRCRPQQISAVLSNLFAVMAESRDASHINVATHVADHEVVVVFSGPGGHLRSNETQAIFEPGFAERSGRVVASSWGLFMARQIVRENGGEMRVEKFGNTGSRLVMTLPASRGA